MVCLGGVGGLLLSLWYNTEMMCTKYLNIYFTKGNNKILASNILVLIKFSIYFGYWP